MMSPYMHRDTGRLMIFFYWCCNFSKLGLLADRPGLLLWASSSQIKNSNLYTYSSRQNVCNDLSFSIWTFTVCILFLSRSRLKLTILIIIDLCSQSMIRAHFNIYAWWGATSRSRWLLSWWWMVVMPLNFFWNGRKLINMWLRISVNYN